VLRALYERDDCDALELVAINELATPEAIAYLTQYDSTHGRFNGEIRALNNNGQTLLQITASNISHTINVLGEKSVAKLPWGALNVDVVLECTGSIHSQQGALAHISAGAKRVLLSNPGEPPIKAVVYGVNHDQITSGETLVSAASCTSNALIPALSIIDQAYGINNGVVTTIHASMHDQPVIDAYHSEDLRKNRAASQSIIPVDTGLAAGIERVLPSLANRFVAHALRVPVNNVSAINVTLNLNTEVSVDQVNAELAKQAQNLPAYVLGCSDEKLASCDFNHDLHSGIIDLQQTQIANGKTVNLLIWFDNEWAFANRMLDLAKLMQA
jgi:glyceraldehyde-3-phosphate dehydrogenase type I